MKRVGTFSHNTANRQQGFTIVELLIVVIVIAILAAITIVAYQGVQNRAIESNLQQTVAQVIKKLDVIKTSSTTGTYPAAESDIGVITPSGMELEYIYSPANDSYCVQVMQSGKYYSARNTDRQIVKGACVEPGLIGWWKLNGNADDSSPSAINGVVTGAIPTTGQDGQSSTAYSLDGIDDMISFGNQAIHNPTTSGFSMSVWFNRAGTLTSERSIVRKDNQYQLGFWSPTSMRNILATSGGINGWVATNDFSYAFSNGVWYHFAWVWDGSTLKSYINGTLAYTANVSGTPLSGTVPLTISSPGRHIQGSVDDLRIYNRALSVDDVSVLYSNGAK
jgi:prepilin-type N-terminal cleavage/methylation domain-containing protein